MILRLSAVLLVFLLSACSHAPARHSPEPFANITQRVSIMAFNVENLFDTTHDPGKDDYTFLPVATKHTAAHQARCRQIEVRKWREQCLNWDWSEAALSHKLRVLSEVILQENGGRGPDIIALQEVENRSVLERLRVDYLAAAGYGPPVLLEGNDQRGIDVAFLSRLPLIGEPRLHAIEFTSISDKRRADTRGILQADFRLPDGQVLTGYSVHFPAPFHPYPLRIDAYQSLNRLLDELPDERAVFAAGDFNTPSREDQQYRLLDRFVAPRWTIAHEVGCPECPGTSYYAPKKEWSFLDMVLFRPAVGASGDWQLDIEATRLVNQHPAQTDESGYPQPYRLNPARGVSDHWPLLIEIVTGTR